MLLIRQPTPDPRIGLPDGYVHRLLLLVPAHPAGLLGHLPGDRRQTWGGAGAGAGAGAGVEKVGGIKTGARAGVRDRKASELSINRSSSKSWTNRSIKQ